VVRLEFELRDPGWAVPLLHWVATLGSTLTDQLCTAIYHQHHQYTLVA